MANNTSEAGRARNRRVEIFLRDTQPAGVASTPTLPAFPGWHLEVKSYLELVQTVLDQGSWQDNRTGIRTLSLPDAALRFDLQQRFLAVTTEKLAFKTAVGELVGFLRASRNAAEFRALGCKVWDQNAYENQAWLANPYRLAEDDLGPVYERRQVQETPALTATTRCASSRRRWGCPPPASARGEGGGRAVHPRRQGAAAAGGADLVRSLVHLAGSADNTVRDYMVALEMRATAGRSRNRRHVSGVLHARSAVGPCIESLPCRKSPPARNSAKQLGASCTRARTRAKEKARTPTLVA